MVGFSKVISFSYSRSIAEKAFHDLPEVAVEIQSKQNQHTIYTLFPQLGTGDGYSRHNEFTHDLANVLMSPP